MVLNYVSINDSRIHLLDLETGEMRPMAGSETRLGSNWPVGFDPRVPVTEAIQIVETLRRHGQPVWYVNALNEGHGYRRKGNRGVYQQVMVLFFREHLL